APLARMVGRGETTKIQWFRNGLNGCPEALTDADGELKWRQHQTALWGKMPYEDLTDGQGVMQNLRFQGQYLDRETGLHYNLFRYYDPDCGRFTQPDPIGLAGGINLYQYAPNPLSWIDPLGLICGRAGKQSRLRELVNDPKQPRHVRGWIQQELNSIARGNRTNIRNPPGYEMAHGRGYESSKGYSYKYSEPQHTDLHRRQHKYDDYGRKNNPRASGKYEGEDL
ncbi:TPA: RHS domain-containing protein, partial [Citrobacter farmeri]|nr:RHS domain-containing protein [Citrobacter farmeri]